MATIRPFKAVRPKPELASKVAAFPYDVLNSQEARELAKDNPYSFLHINKSEIDLDPSTNLYSPEVYEKARHNLHQFIEKGILIQEEKPCLYIYAQEMEGRRQHGLVACASVDEYLANVIKKHELTRAEKEVDRTTHIDVTNANTGPIFLTYRNQPSIDKFVDSIIKNTPLYDFVLDDGIRHIVWTISDDQQIQFLIQEFEKLPSLYIADGHHRAASSAHIGKKRRAECPNYTGNEEFNYFLTVIFPHNQLKILDYNRVVNSLNGMDSKAFLERIQGQFHVEKVSDKGNPFKPTQVHEFGMYLDHQWYRLVAKPESFDAHDSILSLDVTILQNNLLGPVLDILDPRKDKRIDFVGGIRGLGELERRVDSGEMKVSFAMFPTMVEQLLDVADAEKIMPPKSTWFEPKLRSGLFVHFLE